MNTVIVYGSAADPATRPAARDVDIAYTGHRADAAPVVAAWQARHGLAHLPVDWHPARGYGSTVSLPAPCGQRGPYEVLAGKPRVEWSTEWGLSAYVRVHGNNPDRLRRELSRKNASWRLTVIPDPGADPEQEYIEGLTALRNAVAKHPAAEQVLVRQWPDLMPLLLTTQPHPTPQGLKTLRAGSPIGGGGAVSIVLTSGGDARLQYGRIPRLAPVKGLRFPSVRELLYPNR